MEIIGKKTRAAAFVSAVGLMVAGSVTTTPTNAGINPIDVEVVPEQEAAGIKEITDLTTKLQKSRKPLEGQKGKVLRGVHPKSHGCVDATFTINDNIAIEYRFGLFKRPGTYQAKIRYSNASVLLDPDLKDGENGSRGMAIKVLGLNKNLGSFMLEDGDERNQDFLMVNTPEFAFANVRDYLRLTRILMLGQGADPFFIPLKLKGLDLLEVQPNKSLKLNPLTGLESKMKKREFEKLKKEWGFYKTHPVFKGFNVGDLISTGGSFAVIKKIKNQPVRNPLQVEYLSASPFRYGPNLVMKFAVVPAIETTRTDFTDEEKEIIDPDYLAKVLKKTMTQNKDGKKKPLEFSFMVQVLDKSQLKAGGKEMIENAAIAWTEKNYPAVKFTSVKVATITIPAVDEKENLDFVNACKHLQFTPWHTLAEHKPLGGINRLRKPVYCESGEFRRNPPVNANKVQCEDKKYN